MLSSVISCSMQKRRWGRNICFITVFITYHLCLHFFGEIHLYGLSRCKAVPLGIESLAGSSLLMTTLYHVRWSVSPTFHKISEIMWKLQEVEGRHNKTEGQNQAPNLYRQELLPEKAVHSQRGGRYREDLVWRPLWLGEDHTDDRPFNPHSSTSASPGKAIKSHDKVISGCSCPEISPG